ncbi:uncharacterized protein B0I36DRAFT_355993 [Microdochium trichocladiopsis]|uniref:Uncharacterized protein n=1 Tax=Microdochium trichocladiopsis TaxID=1682393 RepID=A0A9P8XSQ8_9PEZI|nr:uncharacterized protein B0I36DRAFT_356907 [Microdochium trichocladiopsis]XP_046004863.1 uncharacterized protein B0I36DRAFT_355993 [Microdochium trichocladiopsis]KAH7007963.1 hypothetical protein B0I36DRAFT_356907 [Microdochium trichocladiopsis]KAH7012598.1 hypothetical protein B0I36DRAFT_355993 [Microdochium trichocladiopsis]
MAIPSTNIPQYATQSGTGFSPVDNYQTAEEPAPSPDYVPTDLPQGFTTSSHLVPTHGYAITSPASMAASTARTVSVSWLLVVLVGGFHFLAAFYKAGLGYSFGIRDVGMTLKLFSTVFCSWSRLARKEGNDSASYAYI